MIVYQVTIEVDADIRKPWEQWMTKEHVPRVLGTGCFESFRMYFTVDPADSARHVYVLQFAARDMASYEEYRDRYAPRLKQEGPDLFPGKTTATRCVLQEM